MALALADRLVQYAYLMRLHKPIPLFLLLWPTLWGLWLASHGRPHLNLLLIFLAGVGLMRSAGCIINDFADRKIDQHVTRTKMRPLAAGKVAAWEALLLAACLALLAFLLVLQCNLLTIQLALIGALLTGIYPFLKRITYLPQLGLGLAFSWGVLMAFAAETGQLSAKAWLVFIAAVIWPVIYDTLYAMADREEDQFIGVKSTAILFQQQDKLWIGILQIIFLCMLGLVGTIFQLSLIYYLSLLVVLGLFIYQHYLIKNRQPAHCLQAFLNNHWVGLSIFLGIYLSYL